MPSGAKKRKAARKKMEKEASSINNGSHSSSQGSDDPRSRDTDVDVEREEKFEGSAVNDQGEGNVAEEMKQQKEGFDDVDVRDDSREFTSVASKISSSSSSTSSSSDDDEVTVEKDEPEEVVTPDDSVVASMENLVVDDYVEERIPLEESVKEVVSLPEESSTVSESLPVDQSLISDVIESEVKEFVDDVLRPSDEKSEVVSAVIDLAQTKIEGKVSPAGDGEGSENASESVGVVVRDTEVLLPQSSSGVKDVDNGKMPETHKYAEEEPLISPAPLPVQRTSVFSCCGLFEAFSGGSR